MLECLLACPVIAFHKATATFHTWVNSPLADASSFTRVILRVHLHGALSGLQKSALAAAGCLCDVRGQCTLIRCTFRIMHCRGPLHGHWSLVSGHRLHNEQHTDWLTCSLMVPTLATMSAAAVEVGISLQFCNCGTQAQTRRIHLKMKACIGI